MRRHTLVGSSLLLVLALLAGCGQKGPLLLPPPRPVTPTPGASVLPPPPTSPGPLSPSPANEPAPAGAAPPPAASHGR